jgi:3-hydroxybutyrate dehydrogenase
MGAGSRSAVVTGSVQGLGLTVARHLAGAGCNVMLSGLASRHEAAAACRSVQRDQVKVLYSDADLRRPADLARMVHEALAAFGAIDIVVNNAVVRHSAAIEDFPPDAWDEAVAVNLTAAFHLIRLALPGMKRNNWGRIVNISSIYGLRGVANRAGYVATKTALIGLTRAVAAETAGHDITCNAVCPGTTDTPVHDAAVRSMMEAGRLPRGEAERRYLDGKQPTGRFVSKEGVADLVVFLCGPRGGDINGAVLPVDGGWGAT